MNSCTEKPLDTKENLVQAFWSLYQEKPIEKITVKAVTDKAGLYRSTLYYYFKDVYEILECIELDILHQWEDTIAAIFTENYELLLRGNIMGILPRIKPFYQQTGEYIAVLLGASGDPQFAQKIKDTLGKRIFSMFEIPKDNLEAQIIFESCSAGALAVFGKYYSKNASFEQIVATFQKILNPNLFQTLLHCSSNPIFRTTANRAIIETM